MQRCSIQGCGEAHNARGWCKRHYERWRIHGDPLGEGLRLPIRPRGLSEAETFAWYMPGDPPAASQCWDWTGDTRGGYGYLDIRRKRIPAHHVAFRIYYGAIGKSWVLHSCDRKICVQPAHLHLGDHARNMVESVERNRHEIGEERYNAKLTDADVRWIRQSTLTHREMAAILGVSRGVIGAVRARRAWKHLA